MLLVANKGNLKRYAKDLLGREYTPEKEKELINICTKRSITDYTKLYRHVSFAIADWLSDINNILKTFGVESQQIDGTDTYIQFCNTGDTYAMTILYYKDKLRIGDWGSIVEALT